MLGRLIVFALLLAPISAQAQAPKWVASWAASPAPPQAPPPGATGVGALSTPTFDDQTLIQVVRLSAGGRAVRVRFTNEYGRAPLMIGAARVAVVGADGAPVVGGDHALTFAGLATATVPPGAPILSDPVDLPTKALSSLRIALYLPRKVERCTCHIIGGQTVQVSPHGDYTQRPLPAASSGPSYRAFLSAVEVQPRGTVPTIVAFGDSITDGYLSTVNTNRRWPDRLAERLTAAGLSVAVVNAGIGGNRVLSDGVIPIFGESALTRFDRDVLSLPGVTHVIVLEGVNDLGAKPSPSASDLIAGYRQLIARAHEHGIKVSLATILPYGGAAYFRADGEAVRQAVNAWIRAGDGFEGVIDFDAAVRDPAKPERMQAALQSGDWLHPNDAGYRVMGDAVKLGLFGR